MIIVKKCVICHTNVARYGDICSFKCGKKFQQNNIFKNLEPGKKNKTIKDKIYNDMNYVNEIKKEIVKFKTIAQEQKQLFFKNKITPMLKEIDGNKAEWNAICMHLKNNYKDKLEYQFIINAFKEFGIKIH